MSSEFGEKNGEISTIGKETVMDTLAHVVTDCLSKYGRDVELQWNSPEIYTRAVGNITPIKRDNKVIGYHIPIKPSISFLSMDLLEYIKRQLLVFFPGWEILLTEDAIQLVESSLPKHWMARMENREQHNKDTQDFGNLNEAEAKKLGLERLELSGYEVADGLIKEVIAGRRGILHPVDQVDFCTKWMDAHPQLPPPCVLNSMMWGSVYPGKSYPSMVDQDGDFKYLIGLRNDSIVKNLGGSPKVLHPKFGESRVLWVDNFEEYDYDEKDLADAQKTKMQSTNSPLMNELVSPFNHEGVVVIRREDIDYELFVGDPMNQNPTQKHIKILTRLGLDPAKFGFRCITYDEYARGGIIKRWGQKNLLTHFHGYFVPLSDDHQRFGLFGGNSLKGGLSDVGSVSRYVPYLNVALRLVLARK